MNLATIRVIWMDGLERVFEHVTASVRDGILHIHQYDEDAKHVIVGEWHFPTNNIRGWTHIKNGESTSAQKSEAAPLPSQGTGRFCMCAGPERPHRLGSFSCIHAE